MTEYEQARTHRDELLRISDLAAEKLQSLRRGKVPPSGIVPQLLKQSPEYQQALADRQRAEQEFRDYALKFALRFLNK